MGSMRFMLEAAGIDIEGGAAGAIKLQGLAFAWARIVGVWLDDDDPGLSKTMAELDRELTRGERAVAGVDRVNELVSPLRAIARAAFDARRRTRERRRARRDEEVEAIRTAARRQWCDGRTSARAERPAPNCKCILADNLKLSVFFESSLAKRWRTPARLSGP